MLLGPRYKAKIIKCGIPQHQNVKIFLAPGRVDIGNGQDLAVRWGFQVSDLFQKSQQLKEWWCGH